MKGIKDADDDIDAKNLLFIGSNQKKFNFNTFKVPLNFLSDIYNDEISLKEAEVFPRDLQKRIQELKFDYRPEKAEGKEKINKESIDAGK